MSIADATPMSTIIPDKSLISIKRLFGIESDGCKVSWKEICCCAVETFSDVSVTVHVTMVSPSGKNSGASLEMEAISTLSYTRGTSNSIVFLPILDASIIISPDTKILGLVVSTTVIVCDAFTILP